ncbi:MAG: Gfo/Idh/MocA family oxidoreductase [Bacteroidota bacterium]|nr:Gfo/Idh/MocA family oxidoreductase [Bacteroidota bacterium]
MEKINWGIIGCGDVAEVKSGPAFNNVKNSSLIAVMRRNGKKAKDFAMRHNVSKWYDNGLKLINDPDVNAIYIATPPSSHEEYTLAAISAGKPVYLEKPMAVNFQSAERMASAAREKKVKLAIAHYRREQPYFKKIKQLLDDKAIGEVRVAQLEYLKKQLTSQELKLPGFKWRVDTAVAGGGLFHDIAPHPLDLMFYFFGKVAKASGVSANQARVYNADDVVAGNILFQNGIVFNGIWCFNVHRQNEKDTCEIIGSEGSIRFSVFDQEKLSVTKKGKTEIIAFDRLKHVQEPMITKVVEYFLGEASNPCSGDDGAEIMRIMDQFTGSNNFSNH